MLNSGTPTDAGIGSLRLARGTLKDDAVAVVRTAILSGEMVPGRIYSANSLAGQLGVSNSPVREAMMELAGKGLLEPVRNRGFRVVEMTDADRSEVYRLRMMIEVPAVADAAAQGVSPAQTERLQELLTAVLSAAAPETLREYLDADQALHMFIVGLLGNRRLCAIVENFRDQSRVRGAYRLAERGVLEDSAREHVALVEAVTAGDAALAGELMASHLAYARPSRL